MNEWVEQNCPEALLADGFEEALVGFGCQYTGCIVAVYDISKCLKILEDRDGMSRETAEEFLHFNTLSAWCGEHTPIFMTPMEEVQQ